MSIAEIKRLVNSGLTPLNKIIGSPNEEPSANGSLHSRLSYLLEKVGGGTKQAIIQLILTMFYLRCRSKLLLSPVRIISEC